MVKVSSSDVIAILRRFESVDDETMPRMVDQIKYAHPSPTNTLVSFRLHKRRYYILFDDTAEDDTARVLEQVSIYQPDATGDVIENPNDHLTSYALPFKGKDVYLFAVNSDKKRLDQELAERYPNTSRSTWQKHIKAAHISVNQHVITSTKYEVTDADTIALDLPEATNFEENAFPIIYIDDDIIVIDKPAGVLTHSKGALNDEFTVADFFARYTTYATTTNRPGIVHRLDRDTSGVMIGARTEAAARMLQKQFAARTAKKHYRAVLTGILKQSAARVELPIARNPSAPSTFRVDAKGKEAVTEYKLLDSRNGLSLVELRPLTGRTHQLRVHMAYLGCPILGDKVYGKLADRLYLHAHSLEVTLISGSRRIFTSPVPLAFAARLEA